ncbi:MAG: class IV adenylate cyclase [Chloroflexi bacterium]|nr:class IV adenylate cyclase [Chloroflexota bacterium]
MPANIEIKARVSDFDNLRQRAEMLSGAPCETIPQVDTFFRVDKGRLKLRDLGAGRAQLIFYQRSDQDGPKRSDYSIAMIADAENLIRVLTLAYGIRGVVKKTRYLYLVGQTRVHVDDVEGLGHFMELEVVLRDGQSDAEGQAIAEDLMQKLGVEKSDLLDGAYMDLIEKRVERSE